MHSTAVSAGKSATAIVPGNAATLRIGASKSTWPPWTPDRLMEITQ